MIPVVVGSSPISHPNEEPCKWDNDRVEMALVRSIAGVPIVAGQSELTRFGCRDLMQANAIDICNFDGGWGGGPTEWRRVANIAHAFGVKVMQYLEPQFGLLISTTKKEFTELVFYTR